MIDRLESRQGDSAAAVKAFSADDYGVDDDVVAPAVLVEGLAQTVAAALGEESQAAGVESGFGMLVGVSGFVFHDAVKAGDQVRFVTAVSRRLPPFYLADGRVMRGEAVVAEGSMKFYIEEQGGGKGTQTP